MNLWFAQDDDVVREQLDDMLSLPVDSDESGVASPQLIPTTAVNRAVAALLVPHQFDRLLMRNGVPLVSGTHVLRHTDRLDYEGRTWWVAARREVGDVPYEAAIHGEDVYCFITKARLQADEVIVVCPGPSGAECGAIYRKAAWEMVQQSNARFRCPRCGFDPAAADWQPTLPRKTNLAQTFDLVRQRREGGAS